MQEEFAILVARAREQNPAAFERTLKALCLLGEWNEETCEGVFTSLPKADMDDVKVREAFAVLAARCVLTDELTSKGSMEVADSIFERVVHRFKYVTGLHTAAAKPGLPYTCDAKESAVVTTWYRTINDLVAFTLEELEAMRGKQGDEHPYTGVCADEDVHIPGP